MEITTDTPPDKPMHLANTAPEAQRKRNIRNAETSINLKKNGSVLNRVGNT